MKLKLREAVILSVIVDFEKQHNRPALRREIYYKLTDEEIASPNPPVNLQGWSGIANVWVVEKLGKPSISFHSSLSVAKPMETLAAAGLVVPRATRPMRTFLQLTGADDKEVEDAIEQERSAVKDRPEKLQGGSPHKATPRGVLYADTYLVGNWWKAWSDLPDTDVIP